MAYFMVYVDDVVLTVSHNDFLDQVVYKLTNHFSIKDLGLYIIFRGLSLSLLHMVFSYLNIVTSPTYL